MSGAEFRAIGHDLVEQIADFLDGIRHRVVTPGEPPSRIRALLGDDAVPQNGRSAEDLMKGLAEFVFDHSLLNGHPRFWGYITSSAAPLGAMADMLASTVNPNVGGSILSPLASEIEAQTVRWIADMVGFERNCGGVLVSGGNMANFVCFLAGRKAMTPWSIAEEGVSHDGKQLVVYCSSETHTWIEKAAELFGQGKRSIRFIPVNDDQQMRTDLLREAIAKDKADGQIPIMIVGAAGTVGTGAVDPLYEIAEICKEYQLWFHVDGAYGAPAILSPRAPSQIHGMTLADSIALDPHKWLYSPLEAGCALVRDPRQLQAAFSHHPTYYRFDGTPDDPTINFHEYGMQNSRGFRALKVWLAIKQAGVEGYRRMIDDDIMLAERMYEAVKAHPELEALSQHLSITTFRYVPTDVNTGDPNTAAYLDTLNEAIVARIQEGGEAFLSNAQVNGKYALRACIVNFRTELDDVLAVPDIVARIGSQLHGELR